MSSSQSGRVASVLRAIQQHGSVSIAAREVGWSYRHAWEYLRRAASVLSMRLTETVPGKGAARGTRLTAAGRTLCAKMDAVMISVRRVLTLSGAASTPNNGLGVAFVSCRDFRNTRCRLAISRNLNEENGLRKQPLAQPLTTSCGNRP